MSEAPPEAKRQKMTDCEAAEESMSSSSSPAIEAILPDSLIKPIIYERCVIATLGDKRKLSEFIREINKALPLPTFQHLKRVRNAQVLLFPEAMFEKKSSDGETTADWVRKILLGKDFPEALIDSCSEFTTDELASVQPQLKCQHEEVVQRWPCKFHEDKALERLCRNENFDSREIRFHCRMMELCLELRPVLHSQCVALTFDPTQNEIVALGWSTDQECRIPSSHSVMRAIDNVAASQGGGAWKNKEDADLLERGLKYGRGSFQSFSDLHLETTEELKYGAYLCTGYDVYLLREPCLMCSMAMVHSRVKRIFYRTNNPERGALGGGTKLKLHGVRELNHHYQVFRVNGVQSK